MRAFAVAAALALIASGCAGVPKKPDAHPAPEQPAPTASPSPQAVPKPAPTHRPIPKPLPSKPAPSAPSTESKPVPSPSPTQEPRRPEVGRMTSPLPPLLKEIEDKYAEAGTLVADFRQVNEVAALGQKKTTTGNIVVKRPDKVRWQTLAPEANLLVSDGRTFWFYTPPFDEGEPGQVVVRKSSEIQSKLANALLAGSFSSVGGARVTEQSPNRYVMRPESGTAGTVLKAEVVVDPAKKLIEKVILEHQGGNRAEITLSKIVLGKPLADSVFRFVPPPNTEKID